MNSEYKTLRELNVKPGDVVESRSMARYKVTAVDDDYCALDGDDGWSLDAAMWRIVSRAPRDNSDLPSGMAWTPLPDNDTPKLWTGWIGGKRPFSGPCDIMWANGDINEDRDAEEIGDLWENSSDDPDEWVVAYRIRPERKRETVTLWGCNEGDKWGFSEKRPYDTHRITLPLIDNTIPAGTYTSAEGHEIIVEKIND
jgi:hypothetical protein